MPDFPAAPRPSWRNALRVYLAPANLRMVTLAFSTGLPFLLTQGTLAFRLSEAGINIDTIGFLSWVGMATYGFKWAWAPLVDRMPLPGLTRWLGRRRSWLLLSQAAVALGLAGMALADPRAALAPLVWCALAVAFASATQDIALDAYRIESAPTQEQPALAATYQVGYRLAMICASAGVLWLAARAQGAATGYDNAAWQTAYLVMAALMAVGMVTVLTAPEPAPAPLPPARSAAEWVQGALVEPFADFIRRYKWQAALILALIAIYRISDEVMGVMANPFYVHMGYTKDQVAAVSKVFGVVMTLTGGFVGGALALRFGVMRVLMLGASLSVVSNLLFAWLASHGPSVPGGAAMSASAQLALAWQAGYRPSVPALVAVISADNLSGGMAQAAFVGYLSSLTNIRYSATQYALFSSLMHLAPKFIGGFTGVYVKAFDYPVFFTTTAALGLPVLLLVALAARAQGGWNPARK
ncbi:MAG: MFS transporter [Desulfovibrionaceae bacterium]|jgi:PAT family beta-lactamase induction signal transducer AmpG|nr:MFS transporter [Desulfovibrionaceae bacterium]